ncbi:MAG: BamA/TamA family outer membrane protein [Polyangiaceae bacterium]|nr:BamA/TamA family outer membrane protein [Polyangiaceae bacterium]
MTLRPSLRWVACLAVLGHLSAAVAAQTPRKRPVPDYDGRDQPTTPGEVALWVPRVILYPAYLVSEYVVRRPIGALVTAAERSQLPLALYDFFMLTEDKSVGWAPVAFYDFGFQPSLGLYFFWNDAFARGNDLRAHASTWGVHWLAASVKDRIHLGSSDTLTLEASGIRRPDYEFYGQGPSSLDRDLSRYGSDRLEASAVFDGELGGASRIETGVGVRRVKFHEPDPEYTGIRERAARGVYALPPSYDTGYAAGFSRLALRLDSRKTRVRTGSGVRLDLDAEHGSAPGRSALGWVRYGGIAGAFVDLNEGGRTLSLSLAAHFSDPLTDRPPPFTELVQLGGQEAMRGFLPGRLLGRSAVAATLSYHWPVWVWLDGTMQAAVGNVFSAHLRDFEPSLLRLSGAIGVATSGFSDNPVELLVGTGTETFEHGAQLTSLRFVAGTSHAF